MTGKIEIQYDATNGQMIIYAPMSNQIEKDQSLRVLAAAIQSIVNYKESAIIKPSGNGAGIPPIPQIPPPPRTH